MRGQPETDDHKYDKTVLLGHFHFHFRRVDFLLCEDNTALQNTASSSQNAVVLH